MAPTRKPFLERLWALIARGGQEECWNWMGAESGGGYGQITIGGRKGPRVRAHRAVYELLVGPIPDGKILCHKCDNRRCCNPEHLFIGSYADNSADMVRKGRSYRAFGEAHHLSKLSDADAAAIRGSSEPGIALAARYSVSRGHVSAIRNGRVRLTC